MVKYKNKLIYISMVLLSLISVFLMFLSVNNTNVVCANAENTNPYLTFNAEDGNEFTLKTKNSSCNWDGTIEYSTNTISWSTWTGSLINSSNGKLYLRGINNTYLTFDGDEDYRSFVFSGASKRIQCNGNIENLLDYQIVANGEHPTMDSDCYRELFSRCTLLITAPELPATTLASSCYYQMFYECTSLITAPELPATTLAYSCYRSMFSGCTSLTTAPELPATTLDESCYANMFAGCKSLTTAPALPATTLDYTCYKEMFYSCKSLTVAPALPATILVSGCYEYMFEGCTSLTTVPELPATTLAYCCCMYMFKDCSSLKVSSIQTSEYQYEWRMPIISTGTVDSGWNTGMLSNTGGTFTSEPSINTTYYTTHKPIAVEKTYTVTVDANGGNKIQGTNNIWTNMKYISEGDVEGLNYLFTRDGYNAVGLSLTADGEAIDLVEYGGNYPVTSDITVYVVWERTGFDFTVFMGKGRINNSSTYIFENISKFTLDNYNYIKNNVVDENGNALSLDHFNLDTVGNYVINESHTFPIIIECDGNLTAYYNYDVVIDANGGSGNITLVNKTKITYDDMLSLESRITREHYGISGLSETANGNTITFDYEVTCDTTLYIIWGHIGYNITYELDGGTLAEDSPTVFFYDDRTIPNAPTKDGYKFKCWYYDAEFTQKVQGELKLENITLYALWKSDYYSVNIKNTILNTGNLFENTKTITQEMLDNISVSGRSNENGNTGTMSGYELKGISKTPNGHLVPIPYTIESDYYDVTLYAVWEEHDKYDVNILFNCDDINRKYEFLNRTINVNMIDIDVYISQLNNEIHQTNPEVTVLGLTKGYGSGNYIKHKYDVDKIQSLYCDLDIDGLCVSYIYKVNGQSKIMHLFTKYVTDNYLGAFPTDDEIREKYPDAMSSNQAVEGWYYDSSFTNKANSTDTITNNISIYLKTRSPYVVMINANADILQNNKSNKCPLYVLYSITEEILNEFISSQVNSNVKVLGLSETQNGSLITLPYNLSGDTTLYLITQNDDGYYNLTIDYSSLFDNNGAYPRLVTKVVNDTEFKVITDVPYGYEIDGYVFEGFYLDSSFTNKKTAESSINADMTIYAKWGYKYTVSIYGNPYSINGSDGEGIYTYNVSIITESDYNNWIYSLNIVVNNAVGVQIKHLSTSRNGNKINLPYKVENNINLYIVWEPLVLNITYELNGGSFGEETTVTSIKYGDTLYLNSIPNPIKENAKFYNWYIDSSFKTLYADSVIKNNITLYAYYRDDINIKFVLDLGEFLNENQELNIKVPYGTTYKYEDIPELKEDISKDFMGWYTAKPFDESNKYTTRVLTEDITLYARWERKWNVSFIIKDYSGIIGDIDVSRGCVPDLTSVYEQIEIESGKMLDCWYIDEDCTTKYNNEPIEQNTSLYGRIVTIEKKDGHTVTFNIYEVDSDTNVVFKKTVSYCSTKYNADIWESQTGAEYQIHLKSFLKEIGYEDYNIYGYSFNMSANDKSLFSFNFGYFHSLRVHFQYMSKMFPNDLYLIFTKYALLDSICDRVNLYLTKDSSGINVNELTKDNIDEKIDKYYYQNRVWDDTDKYSVDVNESKTFSEIFNPIVSQGKESITKFITYIIILLVAVAMLWIIKSVLTSRKRRK